MSDPALALGVRRRRVAAAGAAAVVVPPTRRLAPRVRPYTVTARARLGRGADVGSRRAGRAALDVDRWRGCSARPCARSCAAARAAARAAAATTRSRCTLPPGRLHRRHARRVPDPRGGAGARVRRRRAGVGVARRALGARRARARRVRRRVRRVAARAAGSSARIADRRERIRLELYTVEPAARHARAHRRRSGAGDAAHRRPRARACVVDELRAVLARDAQRHVRTRRVPARRRAHSRARPRRAPTSCSPPEPNGASTSPTACAR